jgi:hypothetical protein
VARLQSKFAFFVISGGRAVDANLRSDPILFDSAAVPRPPKDYGAQIAALNALSTDDAKDAFEEILFRGMTPREEEDYRAQRDGPPLPPRPPSAPLTSLADAIEEVKAGRWIPPVPGIPGSVPIVVPTHEPLKAKNLCEFLDEHPVIEFAVDDMLRRGWLYALTAPTGAGKTAVAVPLALTFATSGMFANHQCNGGPVIYVAGENPDDVRSRIVVALERLKIRDDVPEIYVIDRSFDLTERVDDLVAEVERIKPGLIIVDTDAAVNLGSGDEDGAAERMAQAKKYRMLTRCASRPTVITLCHPGKRPEGPDDCTPRGSGALLNEIDGNFRLWRENDVADLTSDPNKFRGSAVSIRFKSSVTTTEAVKDGKGRLIPVPYFSILTEHEARVELAKDLSDGDKVMRALYETDGNYTTLVDLGKDAGVVTGMMAGDVSKVSRILNDLLKDKLVQKIRRKFKLTRKGVDNLPPLPDQVATAPAFQAPAPFVTAVRVPPPDPNPTILLK